MHFSAMTKKFLTKNNLRKQIQKKLIKNQTKIKFFSASLSNFPGNFFRTSVWNAMGEKIELVKKQKKTQSINEMTLKK